MCALIVPQVVCKLYLKNLDLSLESLFLTFIYHVYYYFK